MHWPDFPVYIMCLDKVAFDGLEPVADTAEEFLGRLRDTILPHQLQLSSCKELMDRMFPSSFKVKSKPNNPPVGFREVAGLQNGEVWASQSSRRLRLPTSVN